MIKQGAVLTADIVNSTAMGSGVITALGTNLENIIQANQANMLSYYRGDSFQSYILDPYEAFRLALLLRVETKLFGQEHSGISTDLKISMGIGYIETPVTPKTAHGETFVLSGRGLDQLGKSGRKLLIQCKDKHLNIALGAISLFVDYLFEALTNKQAEVLQHLLMDRNQLETAALLNKSQSTINKHIQSMGWKQLEELFRLYHETIQQINDNHG